MIDPVRGEFEAVVAGERRRFDTRLSTVAAMELACGDRAIVEVLNGIIVGRKVADQIPLLAAALGCTPAAPDDAGATAGRATVGEAEAFILSLIFALGFSVSAGEGRGRPTPPLDGPPNGGSGAPSPSGR